MNLAPMARLDPGLQGDALGGRTRVLGRRRRDLGRHPRRRHHPHRHGSPAEENMTMRCRTLGNDDSLFWEALALSVGIHLLLSLKAGEFSLHYQQKHTVEIDITIMGHLGMAAAPRMATAPSSPRPIPKPAAPPKEWTKPAANQKVEPAPIPTKSVAPIPEEPPAPPPANTTDGRWNGRIQHRNRRWQRQQRPFAYSSIVESFGSAGHFKTLLSGRSAQPRPRSDGRSRYSYRYGRSGPLRRSRSVRWGQTSMRRRRRQPCSCVSRRLSWAAGASTSRCAKPFNSSWSNDYFIPRETFYLDGYSSLAFGLDVNDPCGSFHGRFQTHTDAFYSQD